MSIVRQFRNSVKSLCALVIVLAIAATLFIGCATSNGNQASNSDSSDQTAKVNFSKLTVARCLRNGGATFAQSADQLSFLAQAEAHDMVTPYGFAYDRTAKLFIELWSKARYRDHREWLMWIGRPFNQKKSPFEIVNLSPSKSYVAYAIRPDPAQRRTLKSCTDEPKHRTPAAN
jgi:hypothetical protein